MNPLVHTPRSYSTQNTMNSTIPAYCFFVILPSTSPIPHQLQSVSFRFDPGFLFLCILAGPNENCLLSGLGLVMHLCLSSPRLAHTDSKGVSNQLFIIPEYLMNPRIATIIFGFSLCLVSNNAVHYHIIKETADACESP